MTEINELIKQLKDELHRSDQVSEWSEYVMDNIIFSVLGKKGEREYPCFKCSKSTMVPDEFDAKKDDERKVVICKDCKPR